MSSADEIRGRKVDIEQYRKTYEADEHWILRKSFLKKHWDSFSEKEILCLAQVFVNIEFLGCRYPLVTMDQVNQLAAEVPEIQKYRASRRHNLKRTFVGAQDAVQAKYKKTEAPRKLELKDWNNEDIKKTEKINQSSMKFTESQKAENLKSLLRDVVFFELEDDENGSLNKTLACIQKTGKLEMKYDCDQKKFFYIFDHQIIGEGPGECKKVAKKLADADLVRTIRSNCYTIKHRRDFYTAENIITPYDQARSNQVASNQIQENNLGFKMLKMLGWKGGSLGSKGDGIVDPINLEIKIGRGGLGSNSSEQFDQKYIKNLLRNFKNNQVEYDLVFSNEFTKEERALIHQFASALDLRTKSYGKNTSRHIVISTKLSTQMLKLKLIEGDGHLLEKYDIVAPPPTKDTKWFKKV